MTVHADCSPSSASIWINCPASVTLARGRTRRATPYTREGTAAHEVAERLVHGIPVPSEITVDGEAVEVSDDMLVNVRAYVDYLDALRARSDVFLTEARLSVTGLPEPLFGTADGVGYQRATRTIEVVDLKYGQGVPVTAQSNPQLRIYGLGAIQKLRAMGEAPLLVTLTVAQPRVSGLMDAETIPVGELEFWAIEVLHPALLAIALDDNDEIPGDHCRWCVRAGECAALAAKAMADAKHAFASKPGDVVRGLDEAELGALLERAELVSAWVNLIRAEATHRAETLGKTIPGWKLVAKRAMRQWTDPTAALLELEQQGVPLRTIVKLVSPAQVERVIEALRLALKINHLWKQESKGNTLVRASDARDESIALNAKKVFSLEDGATPF